MNSKRMVKDMGLQYFDTEMSEDNKSFMNTLTRDQLVLWSQHLRIAIDTMKQEGKPDDYCVLVRATNMREYALKRLDYLNTSAEIAFDAKL